MKGKDLDNIRNVLLWLNDFFTSNTDGDETNLREEICDDYDKAMSAISDEKSRMYKRNYLAKKRRERKSK